VSSVGAWMVVLALAGHTECSRGSCGPQGVAGRNLCDAGEAAQFKRNRRRNGQGQNDSKRRQILAKGKTGQNEDRISGSRSKGKTAENEDRFERSPEPP
jgi:hypothetical protein